MFFSLFSIKKVFTSFLVTAIIFSTYNLAYSFQITLAWDPNSESDLAGYKAYYGTASRNYTFIVNVGKHERVTISNLQQGKKYFFAVTAYNVNGNESKFSNEVSFPQQKSVPWIPSLLLDE